MEHPSAVVLHLGGHEVKVPGLVVSDANIKPTVTSSITGTVGWPEFTLMISLVQLKVRRRLVLVLFLV